MTQTAPVALFIYNRADKVRRTLDALAENPLADQTHLIVFADAARRPEEATKVERARLAAATAKGFARVTMVEAKYNKGLARSITEGVAHLTAEHGRAIILEDDILTSRHFLRFMNDALEKYADDERVATISGYTPPFDTVMPETFFQRDAECWGWATWQRAWTLFNPDGPALLAELKQRNLLKFFDQNGTSNYVDMLRRQIAGKNDSWAVRWRAAVILADRLSLYPGRSLTENIGFDGSGVHSSGENFWSGAVSATTVVLNDIPVLHSEEAFAAFQRFNRATGVNSVGRRLFGRFGALLRRARLP